MIKKSRLHVIWLLLAGVTTVALTHAQESPAPKMDGSKIMTMAYERNQGDDFTRSTSWTFMTGGKERNSMKCDETRKNYRGREGLNFKSVIRYRDPAKISRRSTLTWNYTDGRRDYWYFAFGMTVAQRISDLERIRSQAEFDFNLDDYVEINPGEERHTLLKNETVQGKPCYVVESVPMQGGKKYGKRVSSIDQQAFIPLRVEYYDRKANLSRVLTVTWQQVAGIWFWKEAEVENVQKTNKTLIKVDAVSVNNGVEERDVTKVALEKVK